MTVLLFAVLKEYFPAKIHLLEADIQNIDQLKIHLIQLNPNAETVLSSCRFAVENEFVSNNFMLNKGMLIAVIPPSSGG